jgi:5-hydroxyisourate hydrolase-like protein (transthyretin family)
MNSNWSLVRLAVPAVLCLGLCSCGQEDQSRKKTYPVTGQVYVDGEPASNVAVTAHNVSGMDTQNPTLSSAFTQEDGTFQISTYESSDGVPEGEYVLTFRWGKWDLISGQYGGPDKLNNRYSDPNKSEVRFKVEEGEPTDLGRIELSTK